MSQARTISELLGMGAENARVVLEAFTNAFGKQGTRQLLESAAPPRSPIQDATISAELRPELCRYLSEWE